MPTTASCPHPDQYQRLAAGDLTEPEKESLLQHLAGCDACARRVAALPEQDTLVEWVRGADTRPDEVSGPVPELIERLSNLRPDQAQAPPAAPSPTLSFTAASVQAPSELAEKKPAPGESVQALLSLLAPAEAPDELGRLGPYRVLQVLGEGGMGLVFRAEDPHLQRPVALKVMLPALAATESARQRFLREARAAAAFKHDHIVAIYQVSEDRGVPFLAMEFLEGEPLDVRLQRDGKLPVGEVLRCGRQIALGLAAAHKRGLIHRDIKPANIWLEAETSRVKILDFGLARAAGGQAQLTQQGAIVGTPAYMAPEQGKGQDVDQRSDLFSLGCVLYRMATGVAPFHGSDVISTLMSVATETPQPPQVLEPALPKALAELIVRLLAKDAAQRPESAQDVAESLERIAQEVARPVAARRRPWWPAAGVAAALAVVLIGLLAGGVFRLRTPEGTLVIDVNEPGAEVVVDGQEATVTWDQGRKQAEIRIKPGTRKVAVKVMKEGFGIVSDFVEIEEGGRTVFSARLERDAPETKGAAALPPRALRRDQIAPEALAAAGDGDPKRAPASLVAVLGDPGPMHSNRIWNLTYSGDGRWLASASYDGTVILRDIPAGRARVLRGHTGPVLYAAFSKDGRSLVSASHDGTLKIWPTEKDAEPASVKTDLGEIHSLAASADGRFLAAGGKNGVIKLWTWGQWDRPTILANSIGQVWALAFSPDGELLASGWCEMQPQGCETRVYRTADTQLAYTVPGHPEVARDGKKFGQVRSLAVSTDGKLLASVGTDTKVKVWELATAKSFAAFTIGFRHGVRVCFSPDGKTLAATEGGRVAIFDLATRTREGGTDAVQGWGQIDSLAFSPDGKMLAVGDWNGGVQFYDSASWEHAQAMLQRGHCHAVTRLAIAPDGRTIVSIGADRTLRRWNLDRPGENQVLRRFDAPAEQLAYSPDGKTFATSGAQVIIWDAATGKERSAVPGAMNSLVYSPDGKFLAGQSHGTADVPLWDVELGKVVHRFPSLKVHAMIALAFSPDGKFLAAVGHRRADGAEIVVWDVKTGAEVRSWNDPSSMHTVAFSPDGRFLATGHDDRNIHIRDFATGEKKRTLIGHSGPVTSLKYRSDGQALVSGGVDGTVRVWKLAWDRPQAVIPVAAAKRAAVFDLDASGRYLATGQRQAIFLHRLALDENQSTVTPGPIPQPAPALVALRRERIAPEALAAAGDGDPKRAPASLVGVLGEVTPLQHQKVAGLAFSPDSRWLASASFDKTIFLRDMATGRVQRVLRGHTGPVVAVAFRKDGKTLVSASHDGTLKLWPTEKEAEPQTLQPKLGEVHTCAASPDGRFLAAAGAQGALKLWKWGQWDAPMDLQTLPGKVHALAFSPSGDLLASSEGQGADSRVRLYQTSDGKVTGSWVAGKTPIHALAFQRDGKWLATTGGSTFVRLWDVALGKLVAEAGEWTQWGALALHPDGHTLYAFLPYYRGFLFELPDLKVSVRPGRNAFLDPAVVAAAYSPDGKFLAFGTPNGGVVVWDTATGEKQLPKQGHAHYVTRLAVSPDGRTVLSGDDDQVLRRWDVGRPGESQLLHRFDRGLQDVVWSPEVKKFATTAAFTHYDIEQRGIVWDASTGKQLFRVDPPLHIINAAFSPDGQLFAAFGHNEGCVCLWDANNGKELYRFPKVGVCPDRPAFSADGKLMAMATSDTKLVKVWDVASGAELHSWEDVPMCAVALRPDGRLLATGQPDGAISLRDVASGQKKRTFGGHSGRIKVLKFTPDGKTLISSGHDGTIRVWDPAQPRARAVIPLGPANRPLMIDLDPSGKYLFAAGDSQVIYVLRLP